MNAAIRLRRRLLLPASLVFSLLLGLPSLIVVGRALQPEFIDALVSPVATEALRLSLLTTSLSLVLMLIFATPTAYWLARYRFPGHRLLDTLIDLPLVLPPTVAGVALLLTFGRRGVVGSLLSDIGINLAFTTTAVVMAQLFVATPLYIRALKVGFASVPETTEAAALTLGAGRWRTFWRVTLPLSFPFLIEGVVLAWARALGEFGATIVFAGSFQGSTQTMPLAIYAALESDLNVALALSAILTVTAFGLLLLFRYLTSTARN